MDKTLIFLKRNIGHSRDVLKGNGIKVLRPLENFGGEFVLAVFSTDFERAKELLTAAGIEITHIREGWRSSRSTGKSS
jgi:hypothetical protein